MEWLMGAQGAGGMGGMRNMDWNSLGKMEQLTPQVQRHLTKVYAALSGALLAAVLGAYYGWKFAVTGVWTQIALFGCILGLSMIRANVCRCVQQVDRFPCSWFSDGLQLEPSSCYGCVAQSPADRHCTYGNCHDLHLLLPLCYVCEASTLPLLGRHA
eukprot:754672-Hanusia_phi.AAC.1